MGSCRQSPRATAAPADPGAARRGFRLAGALALVLVGCTGDAPAGRGGGPGGMPPPTVQTVTAEPASVPRIVTAVGSLESPRSAELAAEASGTVVHLDVPEGERVPQGHLLARIDPAQAQADVAVSAARAAQTRASLARLRELRDQQVISAQEFDDAVAARHTAGGELEASEVALRKTTIRAPFAGVLGLRQVSLGAYLTPGMPVARLTQIDPLHLRFTLPERYRAQVAEGQLVEAIAATCVPFRAELSVIDPWVDPATRTLRLQAVVPNPDGRLLPGMSVHLRVILERMENALTVPLEAVIHQGTRSAVYTVADDGTAELQPVELGEYLEDRVQVTKGLAPGDVVVAAGHQKLRAGMLVTQEPFAPIENPRLQLGALAPPLGCASPNPNGS